MIQAESVISDQMAEAIRLLDDAPWTGGVDEAIEAALTALDVAGLAVTLATPETGMEPVVCSGEAARRFEDLQFTVGEGPGVDALRSGTLVLVADLTEERAGCWPLLRGEVLGLRLRSVFCFPMTLGAIRIGVLSAIRPTASRLTWQQLDDALALAAALTHWYLTRTASAIDRTGPLPLTQSLGHAEIHQATGMVSVQLRLPLAQALQALRAHAYGQSRPVTDLAHDIVTRRLRLPSTGDDTPPSVTDKD
ncbi:hypothetical protein GCM10010331_73920 [Streptomyces xanthochromogenes]|uniref:ANTAR domain-containing protein n=1 Tax=Streptomyces xanthochromogenes TaxID=67384 RepID=UPI0016769695|nr:ANTAR domain-containing protein [Streptomyces xanthochromogenes]GHB75190.1 hypothetical protein GCM10010331_73920 [Streptomyces xanthochromogenes]